jgi:type II pantothenate kinase
MSGDLDQQAAESPSSTTKPLRMRTDTAEIDSTIIHPGSVKINVKGAFIVDQESTSPASTSSLNGGTHDTKDIRLPNHTAVVSHIAVDVRSPYLLFMSRYFTHSNGRLEARWPR